MSNGVIPIYSEKGALPNVIGDAGIKIQSDLLSIMASLTDDKRNSLMKKGSDRVKLYTDISIKRHWSILLENKS